jgi:predicted DNA-binding protein (UPF0251 family)
MQLQANPKLNPSLATFDQLPDNAHIRPKPCAQLLGVSIATFWRLVKNGQIKTHKLTERTTTVKAGDLRTFMASK